MADRRYPQLPRPSGTWKPQSTRGSGTQFGCGAADDSVYLPDQRPDDLSAARAEGKTKILRCHPD